MRRSLRAVLLAAAFAAAASRCVPATTQYGGYAVEGDITWHDRDAATATLVVAAAAQPELGADAARVVASINTTCPDIVKLTLRPADVASDASELPAGLFRGDVEGGRPCSSSSAAPPLDVAVPPSGSLFGLAVTRGDGTPLFNTTPYRLLIKPRLLELTTTLPSNATVYGLGERTAALAVARGPTPRALYARDAAAYNRDQNLYGAWPLAVVVGDDGTAHGLLIASAGPMDVITQRTSLTVRLLAPTLTMFVLGGPTVAAVLDAATRIVGRPALPPAWALGAHQSKWGWSTLNDVVAAVAGYDASAIPLDGVWADINYMAARRDWTFNETAYPLGAVQSFINDLHATGRRWIPIVDPGCPAVAGFPAFDAGIAAGAFVRAPPPAALDALYIGTVWPGPVAWPDFAGSAAAREYWAGQIAVFHSTVAFDGLWIDMNEASNFDTSSDDPFSPYCINNGGDGAPLATKTIAPHARSADGVPHAARHNVFGLAEAVATVAGLNTTHPNQRPFILSRSTFLGAGAYAAHWTGDNNSSWPDLAASIPGVLAAGLAGIPFAGADVCGFAGAASEGLCAAWTGAAAFLPFLRNHAAIDAPPQEPWRWPSVATVARRTYGARYALLPHLYTLLAEATTHGTPAARPLWSAWPASAAARAATGVWLLGDSLFVAPTVTEAAVAAGAVTVWLPPGRWCDVWGLLAAAKAAGGRAAANRTVSCFASPPAGRTLSLPSSPSSPALLLAAGSAIAASALALEAWHVDGEPDGPAPVRALAAVISPLTILAVSNAAGAAKGTAYIDDGVSRAPGAWLDIDVTRAAVRVRPRSALPRSVSVSRAVVVGGGAGVVGAEAGVVGGGAGVVGVRAVDMLHPADQTATA